ncbi:MAG: ATP synthase F0 subunit C [Bdellovibrionota bacterium]
MKSKVIKFGVIFSGFLLSSVAMAFDGAEGSMSNALSYIAIGAGLAVGMATMGAATGQGKAASTALEGIARNPGSADKVFMPFILGLVFMEFQALLGFVIAIMWTAKFAG